MIACQNDSYSLQISKLIEDGRNDLESVQDQLKGSQISSKFYLMYIHESIARLIYLEKGKGDVDFVDVKCELDENSLETFSTFKPPLQIKVTGIVKMKVLKLSLHCCLEVYSKRKLKLHS